MGLGACDRADEITVRWPNAQNSTQTFTGIEANQFVKLKQGDATPYKITLQ